MSGLFHHRARPGLERPARLGVIGAHGRAVQEISAASREQDHGADQINQAVQQLDQVVQQNAAGAEQLSATSEEMTQQARRLSAAVAFFRLPEGGTGRIDDEAMKTVAAAAPKKRPAPPPKRGIELHLDEDDGDDAFVAY